MSKLSDEGYRSIPLNATLAMAALVVIMAGMKMGSDLLVPLLLAIFIAVVCTSPVHWLNRCGLSLRLAVFLTLIFMLVFISLIGLLVVNSFSTFIQALPDIETRLYEHYWDILNALASRGLAIDPDQLSSMLEMEGEGSWMQTLLGELGNLFMQSSIVALLVIFLMFETLNFRDKVSRALENPAPSLKRFSEFSLTLKRYLAVKTVISLATGILVWLSCLMVGVEFPLLWGVLAFALNFIPNIGSAIAAIPPVLLLLVSQNGGIWEALLLASTYLAINFVLGNLVEPRIMGQALGLSTFVAFLSLVVWGWVFGVAGMLLSVVLTMTLKIALDSHPQTRWMAHLLGPGSRRGEKSSKLDARRPPWLRRH
ncbi:MULTISPECIES: AI-2E family transporter [Halomonadaceae]|jgi:predicted PurR-regulated permease PerM|uniref:AI-2E family transporter n=1 Tax=Vreelandella janggokensis TaxID=370767 RepID=A0ABT4IPD0_9GAMM|nr:MULTISPECIES: AI-2E family transporter [Halomonas]MCW4152385.1 AI-2E family transporter [Halomonas sp. 18H]MCZ0925526.1 AI-2E family transporter [Halomonas janggokensis]MCZ0931521.1 AI-2E family transporter [Halomonas janggokensis]MDR5886963.1 AI-2E family transporter [Halomonas janggokensis]QPL47432.1 AI-2E family transporter [Halomonas sp. A40-4]